VSVIRTYQCETLGIEYEVEQRITDPTRAMCDRWSNIHCVPKSVIVNNDKAPHFKAGPSGGWSNTGYSKTTTQRRAEGILGRPLVKSEK
jgi:hypothetical protein